jgi:hypothetical protein
MQKLKGISLISERKNRLKSLTGFDNSFRLPARLDPATRRRINDMAAQDLRRDIENRFATLRERFHYRRKDFEVMVDEGTAAIRTPDFEYSVSLEIDSEDPSSLSWIRKVEHLEDPDLVGDSKFQAAFEELFDTLACQFQSPAPIETIIDALEEKPPQGLKLDYDSSCTWCELWINGFPGHIRIEGDQLHLRGGSSLPPAALAELLSQIRSWVTGTPSSLKVIESHGDSD